jgi:acyl-CoA thioester hydrolase
VARVYTARFPVHQYHLDPFGELRSSHCVRFLQQAATDASADAGFGASWYGRAGTLWLIRRSTVEYLRPVRAGTTVTVRTWVADFRRVRSQREYEALAGDGEPPAVHAHTDWVYVDGASGRPRRIPEEMIRGFMPDGAPPALPRPPWPDDAAPAGAFTAAREVGYRDLDTLVHVNNATYLDYVEETAVAALAAAGWPLPRLVALGGWWRPRLHDIEYLEEAVHGDALRCATWVSALDAGEIERRCDIRRADAGTLLARARSRWAWVDRERRAPVPVPAALAAVLAP